MTRCGNCNRDLGSKAKLPWCWTCIVKACRRYGGLGSRDRGGLYEPSVETIYQQAAELRAQRGVAAVLCESDADEKRWREWALKQEQAREVE